MEAVDPPQRDPMGEGLERVGRSPILVGLLCLRAPLQTAVVLGLLIGATWVVGGVIGGAVVLIYPGESVVTLAWLLGIVLLVAGVVLVARGLFARRSTLPTATVAAP